MWEPPALMLCTSPEQETPTTEENADNKIELPANIVMVSVKKKLFYT